MMYRLAQKYHLKTFVNCMYSLLLSVEPIDKYFNRRRLWTSAPVICMRTVRMDASVDDIERQNHYCRPWVVKVFVPLYELNNQPIGKAGTGFIVDYLTGLVITNYHVVADKQDVIMSFADLFNESDVIEGKMWSNKVDNKITGRVVYVEPQYDLALIRMSHYVSNSLSSLDLSETDAEAGDECMTIGCPKIHNTMDYGLVCSAPCKVDLGHGCLVSACDRYLDPSQTFTVHSSSGSPGSSGAPIVNMDGLVIGVLSSGKDSKINIAAKATDVYAFFQRGQQYMNNEFIDKQNDRQKRFERSFSLGVILTAFIVKGFTYNATQARKSLKLNDIIKSVNGIQLTDLNQLTGALDNITSDNQIIHLTVQRVSIANDLAVDIKPQINNNNEFYL
ncbi:probable periplasmic serine endoprotease DegP-like [Oppia nitens]|uniref:probable periplasmic serine endoprotease DegP-like n=1 Tax=Oppia nitens TaxID=1686743 RepID=UPI0023D9B039|nr:probable periplasmic serine endoprotease DegP-like [Oppia nitens]XP_054165517.1 probable periplasmic serine endoprotease DegP-like [Oppia nitens]